MSMHAALASRLSSTAWVLINTPMVPPEPKARSNEVPMKVISSTRTKRTKHSRDSSTSSTASTASSASDFDDSASERSSISER